jgi:hypothetical protein
MKVILISIILLVLAFEAFAEDSMVSISWDIGIPVRDTHEFVHKVSWRGIGLEARKWYYPDVSLGLSWHWSTFFETTDRVFEIENGHVSGTQNRRIYSSPILAHAYYHFQTMDDPDITAYAGLGMGAYWISRRFEIGIWALDEANWHFGLAPEVGVTVPVTFDAHLLVGVRYNYAFKGGASSSHAYWTFMLGLSYVD